MSKKKKKEEIQPIKLGKGMKLEYIPFSKLINPWLLCFDSNVTVGAKASNYASDTIGSITKCNSRALKTIKRETLESLKQSIRKFGLLKPFEVAKLSDDLKKECSWLSSKLPAEYAIIDGQRRYFAIRELLDISEREDCAWKSPKELADLVLIPCLVYPYQEFRAMQRHSIEDNKFSVRPKGEYIDCAERMTEEETDIDIYREKAIPIIKKIRKEKARKQAEEAKREQEIERKREEQRLRQMLKQLEKGKFPEEYP